MIFPWKGLLYLAILTVISNQVALAGAQTLQSPLEQVRSGVAPQDVKCPQGLELVINGLSGEPACVGLSHIARLLAAGWVTPDTYATLHPPINQAKTGILQKTLEDSGTGSKTITDIAKTTVTPGKANHLNQTSQHAITNNENTISNSTSNLTRQTGTILVGVLPNGKSNITSTGANDTLTPSENFPPHHNPSLNGTSSQIAAEYENPDPLLPVNYTVSSNHPNDIKILKIGMDPASPKVGDKVDFSLTYQNISNRTFYHISGGGIHSLGSTIEPSDNVMPFMSSRHFTDVVGWWPIHPKEISRDVSGLDLPASGLPAQEPVHWVFFNGYQIVKAGTLHVSLHLDLMNMHKREGDIYPTLQVDTYDIVQFDVNVPQ